MKIILGFKACVKWKDGNLYTLYFLRGYVKENIKMGKKILVVDDDQEDMGTMKVLLEKIGATSLLITETEQVPKIFSTTGVEEFLAGGVVVLYNLKHGNVRENALEILKLRGASHQKKIVSYQITGKGITVYPDQEVFSEIK
ncbi:hypothetical protein CMI45_01570 [Candidatus Pacearchaeota archaeon]|nr:hypothetical protein [Candidatus Pacearchaeota archaeon]